MGKVYVVTAPESIRGIYEDWPSCQGAVHGVAGARFQAVSSRTEAEAMLTGGGVTLEPGEYVFIDGNGDGGVGIVMVAQERSGQFTEEVSTTVQAVFERSPLPGLEERGQVSRALGALRNVLAELAACYQALLLLPPSTGVTLVYDYQGIEAWLTGAWATRDPHVTTIVQKCRMLINTKQLRIGFRHQPGHRSSYAATHELASYNARADQLARDAVGRGGEN